VVPGEREDIRKKYKRKYYVLVYEKGKIRPVEIILSLRGEKIKEMDGGVNLTEIYCKHFCECHSASPVQ
jgi:hypothetical protein